MAGPHRKPPRLPNAIGASALVLLSSALAVGCAGSESNQSGVLKVHTVFTGNVPGQGQPFVIGVLGSDGRVRAKKDVRAGGDVNFRVPAGTYSVAAWLMDSKLTPVLAVCSTKSTIASGQSLVVRLACEWH